MYARVPVGVLNRVNQQETISLLQKIQAEHGPSAFACSFGLEDMVLLDMIAKHARKIEVFTLDTGRLPEETQAGASALMVSDGPVR